MLEIKNVRFAYAASDGLALDDVSVVVRPGERIAVFGVNGSGKSTLARIANGSAKPISGEVWADGERGVDLVRAVGYVRQDPTCQLVSARVFDEVCFGPANLGLERREVVARANEALARCHAEHLADKGTAELSGGQQQLIAIAGVIAMRPRYLVLDEVTSHLDPRAGEEVAILTQSLVDEGVGVLEMVHDVRSALGATRVMVLKGGRVAWEGAPTDFLGSARALDVSGLDVDPCARAICAAVRAGASLEDCGDPGSLAAFALAHGIDRDVLGMLGQRAEADASSSRHELALEAATVSYGGVRALDAVTLASLKTVTLVAGLSGSGKTTAACALAGVIDPDDGAALLDGVPVRPGCVGLAFQRPETQLFADTVADDIAFGPRNIGLREAAVVAAVTRAAHEMGLGDDLLGRSPFSLSGGQRRRVELAGLIALGYGAYVLDEPSAGLDSFGRNRLRAFVRRLARGGASVVVVTHAVGEWLSVADHVVFLRDGRVASSCDAGDAWASSAPYEAAGLPVPYEVRVRELLGGGACG